MDMGSQLESRGNSNYLITKYSIIYMISNNNNTALTIGAPKIVIEVVTTKGILIDNFIDEVTDTTPTFKRLQEMWAELHPEDKPPEDKKSKSGMEDSSYGGNSAGSETSIKVSCGDENGQPIEGAGEAEIFIPSYLRRLSFMTAAKMITEGTVLQYQYTMNFNGVLEEVRLLEAAYYGVEAIRIKRSNGMMYDITRNDYERDTDWSIYCANN